MPVGGIMPSSPDSSSDSSVGSPHNQYDGPNLEAESALPGVVSHHLNYFLINPTNITQVWRCFNLVIFLVSV